MMKRLILLLSIVMVSLSASPQGIRHIGFPHLGKTRSTIGREHEPYIGKKKGLVLLVDFKNKKFEEGHTHELYEDILNKVGFKSDLGFKGSVKDYFLSQSQGKFELDFDVIGPLSMPNTYGYYGANTQDQDNNPAEMVVTACEMADSLVDFRDYDWDGDGEVDQVFVVYAGLGEAAGGDANTIWPHETALEYFDKKIRLDSVDINTYACGPELVVRGRYTKTTGIEGIGSICHEFAHCLGLPDMYDYAYKNYGMGHWDLMHSGNYNGDSFSPANLTSYERMYCGWLQPIELKKDTTITGMKALDDGGEAYIIYNDAHRDEYYLLENRQQTGWDEGLPGSGLLVIHVDYDEELWRYNLVNNTTWYDGYNKYQRCTIIPADNSQNTKDEAYDAFPYKEKDSLTNNSLPRAELHNLNPDGIHYMSKPITQIKVEDGLVSFVFKNQVGGTSAISAVCREQDDDAVYDLQGRFLGRDIGTLGKGVYIVGGKKVVVR